MSEDKIMPLSARELIEMVERFIVAAEENNVRMILIGGGAVNFHGVQRHSADIDFWIETSLENLDNLAKALRQLGYGFDSFPDEVCEQKQNISIHISPVFKIELITYLNFGVTFEQAWEKSVVSENEKSKSLKFRILSFQDLINSKLKAGRPKDLYDVLRLQETKENDKKKE
jgi:predicted nucleotidyltransferase component of viral defense system